MEIHLHIPIVGFDPHISNILSADVENHGLIINLHNMDMYIYIYIYIIMCIYIVILPSMVTTGVDPSPHVLKTVREDLSQ